MLNQNYEIKIWRIGACSKMTCSQVSFLSESWLFFWGSKFESFENHLVGIYCDGLSEVLRRFQQPWLLQKENLHLISNEKWNVNSNSFFLEFSSNFNSRKTFSFFPPENFSHFPKTCKKKIFLHLITAVFEVRKMGKS